MNFFFDPKSIAVIGASKRPWGSNLISNILRGFEGNVFPVNPNYDEIEGLACYPSVEDVPGQLDLAIILVPAPQVPAILESCGRKKVKGAMIESGGFAEIGHEGKELEERCLAIAKRSGMRLWGPNCLGMVDVPGRKFFTFTFTRIFESNLLSAPVSLVVQSGALAGVFLPELMSRCHIGLSKVCSIGNKIDVDECDVLDYLLRDEKTSAIALYLESIPRGRLFLKILAQSSKPIVVLKVGKSQAGARAAMSHTASLAGEARLTNSLLEAAGVELTNDFHQMVDLARTLAIAPQLSADSGIAVLTPSGASAVLSCDLLERYGLRLASLCESTFEALSSLLPAWMPPSHPVDVGLAIERLGSLSAAIEKGTEILLQDSSVDIVLIHYFFIESDRLNLKALKEKADRAGKMLAFWGVGFQEDVMKFQVEAQSLGVLVYSDLSRATECLAAARRYQRRKSLPVLSDQIESKPSEEPKIHLEPDKLSQVEVLDEFESKGLLRSWGIPVVEERLVSTLSEARQAAKELGFPLVVKGLLPGIIHKSERGLVEKDVHNSIRLKEAFAALQEKMAGQGRILIQTKVKIDYEMIAGFLKDDQFGPCIMVGLGGLFAELEPDIAFALAALDQTRALELLRRIRSQKIFEGYRGLVPLDRTSMANLLVKLSQMGVALRGVKQIDLNPVAVSGGIPVVVDANIVSSRS